MTVLFVCEFGTAKSAIARELLRRKVSVRGLPIEAISRGLVIEDHITAELRAHLVADGIDTLRDPPMVLQPRDWDRASIVVAFNPLPAAFPAAKVRDWIDLPSVVHDYDNAMAILNRRLDALVDEMAAAG